MWGSVATVMLVALVSGWLFLFGWIVRKQAQVGAAAADSYHALIRRWDLLRIPRDPALQLTVFAVIGVFLVICFWGFLPVTTPHPHEDYPVKETTTKTFEPVKALEKAEQNMLKAEIVLEELEKKSKGGSKQKNQKKRNTATGSK
jgi:hypothetical protein